MEQEFSSVAGASPSLESDSKPSTWLPISTAPRDGTVFLAITEWDLFPQAVCWERPSSDFDDGSHKGEPGQWVYADFALHDAVGESGAVLWMPLPEMPPAGHRAPWVTIKLQRREDGGLRIFSDDAPGLILSGSDPEAVVACLWPALTTLGVLQHLSSDGESEPKAKVTEPNPSSSRSTSGRK